MTYLISDNIVSPLGFSTEENFSAIMRQQSAIKMYNDELNNHIPYCAALMNQDQINEKWNSLSDETAYTRFEKMAILSIQEALNNSNIDPASPDTLFILSTTKGNIELIDPDFPHHFSPDRVYLWKSAQLIGQFFENPHPPIVISSACISGVTALITAKRLLDCDAYKNVIVCGADLISRFVMTGFQSLKGLSDQPCRPYDKEHCGLNLGEGAATIILSNRQVTATNSIKLIRGSIGPLPHGRRIISIHHTNITTFRH
ncbi:MAG: beta-ketoacyl synthase N-terminal-like domain-containing protein [Bacteroidales bacterium]